MSTRSQVFPALLATATFVALVVAAFGFVSLFTGTEVIANRTAGTLVGPVMVLVTGAMYFLGLVWLVQTWIDRRSLVPVLIAVTLGSPVVYSLAGGIVQLFATGRPAQLLIDFAGHLISAYSVALGASALVIGIGFWLVVLAPRGRGQV